jgi:hypothetical protein
MLHPSRQHRGKRGLEGFALCIPTGEHIAGIGRLLAIIKAILGGQIHQAYTRTLTKFHGLMTT